MSDEVGVAVTETSWWLMLGFVDMAVKKMVGCELQVSF